MYFGSYLPKFICSDYKSSEGKMINLGLIHNWIILGFGSLLGIAIIMLTSKFIVSKNIPLLSPAAGGVLSFWHLTTTA